MMHKKGYGIIETLSPLHVGATAGEEAGNLNLIFRDQFCQTGIIPGSSIRGRFRAEMQQFTGGDPNYWYGQGADSEQSNANKESIIKFEHASIVWFPVFCPGQPIVWVSCPYLLKRYQRITGKSFDIPSAYTGSKALKPRQSQGKNILFFNLGFLEVNQELEDLSHCFPSGKELPAVIVKDADISMIHDMALYRQSRVRLKEDQKVVDGGGFFNTEALPEGTILVFPIAIKNVKLTQQWEPFGETDKYEGEMYLGGLESIGFGHCAIALKGVKI